MARRPSNPSTRSSNRSGPRADNALFDQRVVYDSVNHRYIVTMENLGPGGTTSNIDIAVSHDSNPNDGWYFASLDTTLTINGNTTLSDRPTVAVDGTNIYIATGQSGPGGFAGSAEWVISDTAGANGGIYNGGTMTVVASQVAPASQGAATVIAVGQNGTSYYVSGFTTATHTNVTLQTYDAATQTFGAATTLALGDTDQGPGGTSYTAQQLGTSVLLDAGNSRIQGVAYANGFIYGVSEVLPNDATTPEIHWFKMDVSNPASPRIVAEGDISGAAIGTNVAVFNPSIAVDAAGDMLINFTASGPNMYPSAYYVYDAGNDPTNAFSAPVLYQASATFLNNGDQINGLQRWGINSSAVADPNNAHSFWLSGEYVDAGGTWETSVTQVALTTAVNTTGTSNQTVSLGTATDVASFAGGTNMVFATDGTLGNGDTLTGGTGTDTLNIADSAAKHTYTFGDGVAGHNDIGLSNFEQILFTRVRKHRSCDRGDTQLALQQPRTPRH